MQQEDQIQKFFSLASFLINLLIGILFLVFTKVQALYESSITCIDLRSHALYFAFALETEVLIIIIFVLLFSGRNQNMDYTDCFNYLRYCCYFAEILLLYFMFNDLIKSEQCGFLRILVFSYMIALFIIIQMVIILKIILFFRNSLILLLLLCVRGMNYIIYNQLFVNFISLMRTNQKSKNSINYQILKMYRCDVLTHSCQKQHLICTYIDCEKENRKLCSECRSSHEHKQDNFKHIIEQSEFFQYISDQIQPETVYLKHLKQILNLDNDNKTGILDGFINKLLKINSAEDKQIKQIFYQINQEKSSQQPINDEQNLNQQDDDQGEVKNKLYESISFSKHKFPFDLLAISPFEQYILLGVRKSQMIMNIRNQKKLAKFFPKNSIQQSVFNNQSNLIISGDFMGNVYCLGIKSKFKQIRKTRIHTQLPSDLKLYNNVVVTSCCADKSIVLIDMQSNSILYRIKDSNFVFQIDYDHTKDVVICLTRQGGIRCLNNKNQILVEQNELHKNQFVWKIQLINDCQHILSGSEKLIKLWSISYSEKCLIQIRKFQTIEMIFSFQSVQDDKNIIIITQSNIFVTDSEFNFIHKSDHQILNLSSICLIIIPQHISRYHNQKASTLSQQLANVFIIIQYYIEQMEILKRV